MLRFNRLCLVLSIFFSIPADGQFSKSIRMAGASAGSIFINAGSSDQTVTSIGTVSGHNTGFNINLTPAYGWFVSDKTVVGFSLNINPSSEKQSFEENGSTFQKDKTSNFNIGMGGFVRNYFKGEGALLPYGQLSLDGGIANTNTDGFFYGGSGANVYKETYTGKSSGGFYTNAVFNLGITKMVGEYTGLDLYLGYNFYYTGNTMNKKTLLDIGINGSIDETKPNETKTTYTNHRFIIGLGFQVFLEKKK